MAHEKLFLLCLDHRNYRQNSSNLADGEVIERLVESAAAAAAVPGTSLSRGYPGTSSFDTASASLPVPDDMGERTVAVLELTASMLRESMDDYLPRPETTNAKHFLHRVVEMDDVDAVLEIM